MEVRRVRPMCAAGDVIVAVAPGLEPREGERIIDAAGLAVAPGFIDSHSHAAGGLGRDPGAAAHVRQITTAIVGQDGGSDLPVAETVEGVERTPRQSTWQRSSAMERSGAS